MDIPTFALSGIVGGFIGAVVSWLVIDTKTRQRIDTLERQVTRLNAKLGSSQAAGPWWLQMIQGLLSNPEVMQKLVGAVGGQKDDFAHTNEVK